MSRERLKELYKLIDKHNYQYHALDDPIISDFEFDKLCNERNILEKEFPEETIAQVGYKPLSKFEKSNHKIPMLSLDNAFSNDDMNDFINRSEKYLGGKSIFPIIAEPKIDGLSISLVYKNGNLLKAITRGDGEKGEVVTQNILSSSKHTKIPKEINYKSVEEIEIRGEIFMHKYDFEEINKARKIKGDALFANPRNAAAGTLRQLDPKIVSSRPLGFFAYSLASTHDFISSHKESLEFIERLKFPVNPHIKTCNNINEVFEYYDYLYSNRPNLSYEIDGIVYKTNDISIQKRLGYVGRAPRHSIARKFPAEQAISKIENIKIQVGRTGILTPVAELLPIGVGGVIVSRATLHNNDEIKRKDIRIGDYVYIERSGDVIPKIISVIMEKRDEKTSSEYIFPENCPSCNEKVYKNEKDVAIRCINPECKDQIIEKLSHFSSKHGFNIDGLSKQQIQSLYNWDYIKTSADIINIKNIIESEKESLTSLYNRHGFGEKSIKNLIKSIEKSKKITLDKFIYSLGIYGVGQKMSKTLSHEFKTIENFYNIKNLTQDELCNLLSSIDGIGSSIIDEIYNFISEGKNQQLMEKLISSCHIEPFEKNTYNNDHPLFDKRIVFTGTLKKMTRHEAKDICERYGASVLTTLSKSVDYLIYGEKSGSKIKKADSLNIKKLNEDMFLNMIK